MTELHTYVGRVGRLCNECGVEIEVQRPTRVLGKESSRSWRSAFRKEVQAQVFWEATCPCCRRWWNEVLRRIQDGPSATSTAEPAAGRASGEASPEAPNPTFGRTSQ
jgi:hypothetical protein